MSVLDPATLRILQSFDIGVTPAPSSAFTPREPATPASSSSFSSNFQAPKRRQFTSCDACRLRKAKCTRTPENVQCDGCFAKGITCTTSIASRKQGGKRLQEARQLFGAAQSSSVISLPKARPNPVLRSANDALLSSSALRLFLDKYLKNCCWAIPTTKIDHLYASCEAVSFEFDSLGRLDQLLCLATAALAARVDEGIADKSAVGSRSDTVSRAVANDIEGQLVSMVDRISLTRQPSNQSLQILRMMMMLKSDEESAQLGRSYAYRSFEQSYADHLRHLYSKNKISTPDAAIFFWAAGWIDAFTAASSGDAPSYTPEDVENYGLPKDVSTQALLAATDDFGWYDRPIDNLQNANNESSKRALADYWNPDRAAIPFITALYWLFIRYWDKITSVKARKADRLDIEAMQSIISEIDRLRTLRSLYEANKHMHAQTSGRITLLHWCKLYQFSLISTVLLALRDVKSAYETAASMSISYAISLQQLQEDLEKRFMQMSTWLENVDLEPGMCGIFGAGDSLLSYMAIVSLRQVHDLPAVEEGAMSPAAWTMQGKLGAAEDCLNLCEVMGRCVESMQKDLPSLRVKTGHLRERAKLFVIPPAGMPAAVEDDLSQYISWDSLLHPQ